MAFIQLGFPAIHHVPGNYPTIQAALSAAAPYDTILIADGEYFENIHIHKPLVIASNFIFSQDTLHIGQTVINGNANGSVIRIEDVMDGNVELFGFTVTGGNGTPADPHGYGQDFLFGGGLFIENCNFIHLNHLNITENIITTDHNSAGGIYAYNTDILINFCDINNNIVNGGSFLGEGAGIFIYESSATIDQCTITGNAGGQVYGEGGGIYARFSDLSVSNTLINNNSCVHSGGIYAMHMTGFELDHVQVINNEAEFSAALYIYNSETLESTITNCEFSNNFSNNSGGAVAIYNLDAVFDNVSINDNEGGLSNGGINFSVSTIEMKHSEIRRNTSSSGIGGESSGLLLYLCEIHLHDVVIDSNECLNSTHFNEGGGITLSQSNLVMDSVRITNNIADQGGAIRSSQATIEMRNCLIANNTAYYEGGITYSYDTDFLILNSTLVDNHAGVAAIYSRGNRFLLLNSILWNPNEAEVYFHTEYNDESYVDIAYSDIRGADEYIVTNNYGEVTWHDGNIFDNPQFTDPENLNYTLQELSPLIDAGTAYFELDGNIIIDYVPSEYNGVAPDMGAFEYEVPAISPTNNIIRDINIFPNPFNEYIIIHYPFESNQQISIKLFDFSGKNVFNQSFSSSLIHFSPGDLNTGLYLLQINDG